MYTLFLDTHSECINIVLYKENSVLLKKSIETKQNHSVTTMPILESALKEAKIKVTDLNQILVVNGPGSFTGVRIGVTIAKTLAFTLNIPIKIMSSLLIKAVSLSHDAVTILEREKNGVFLGDFNKDNKLVGEYRYVANNKFQNEEKIVEDVEIDYEKIIVFASSLESTPAHAVNPLYVKKIEVQK